MENARTAFRSAFRPFGRFDMNTSLRRRFWLIAGGILMLAAAALGYPDIMEALQQSERRPDAGIPTSFSGNRAIYGFALFSLFSMSSLAIRKLILICVQLRDEPWRRDPDVGFMRMTIALVMLVIILGAGPDVLTLLLWGEVSQQTLVALMTFDRLCDSLTIVPFLAAIFTHIKGEQFQRTPCPQYLPDLVASSNAAAGERKLFVVVQRSESIAENIKIIIGVLIIAAGLAIWK